MKKLIAVTGAILIACVVIGAAASPSGSDSAAQTVSDAVSASSQADGDNRRYIVKSVNDTVVVYLDDGDTVYLDTGRSTESLPQGDRLRLEQGIEVYGGEKLKKLIEDYCS